MLRFRSSANCIEKEEQKKQTSWPRLKSQSYLKSPHQQVAKGQQVNLRGQLLQAEKNLNWSLHTFSWRWLCFSSSVIALSIKCIISRFKTWGALKHTVFQIEPQTSPPLQFHHNWTSSKYQLLKIDFNLAFQTKYHSLSKTFHQNNTLPKSKLTLTKYLFFLSWNLFNKFFVK